MKRDYCRLSPEFVYKWLKAQTYLYTYTKYVFRTCTYILICIWILTCLFESHVSFKRHYVRAKFGKPRTVLSKPCIQRLCRFLKASFHLSHKTIWWLRTWNIGLSQFGVQCFVHTPSDLLFLHWESAKILSTAIKQKASMLREKNIEWQKILMQKSDTHKPQTLHHITTPKKRKVSEALHYGCGDGFAGVIP